MKYFRCASLVPTHRIGVVAVRGVGHHSTNFMKSESEKQGDCKAVEKPPQDRMIRRPASTRDVLGRDPKGDVIAGANGLIRHPTLKRMHD